MADPDSLALLSFLCHRLAGLPVAVLGTLRPWPPAARELVNALVHDDDASMLRLAPLSVDSATRLLTLQAGWRGDGERGGPRGSAVCGEPAAVGAGRGVPRPARAVRWPHGG
ncbi:MAG: hypothetical protein ACRDQI_13850 [Pseudonocardiaceae bacterium]